MQISRLVIRNIFMGHTVQWIGSAQVQISRLVMIRNTFIERKRAIDTERSLDPGVKLLKNT